MTRAELAKIFNEVDAEFRKSKIQKEILTDMYEDLQAGKDRDFVLLHGAFELSNRFTFEVMSKVLCCDSENNR